MEEDIKILEEFINYKNINNLPYQLIAISHERLCEAIENLIAIYKELETHYKIICDDLEEHNLIYTDTPEFEEKYIPKSKVQEKIEELENLKLCSDDFYKAITEQKIKLLKLLLED